MKLPMINDIRRHNSALMENIKNKVNSVLDSGRYILGNEVTVFEKNFASYCGTNYCLSLGNGTDSIEIALRAIGIQSHDKVATVANAGMYATTAITLLGAIPIYIDINRNSLNMCIESLEKVINEHNISAIIITHLYGLMADVNTINHLAKKYNIKTIEDCAQAHGAVSNNKKAGSYADISCFSFYPTKNLGALGDGGAIVTNNEKYFNNAMLYRQYGWKEKYNVTQSNCRNSRLDEIQAAILNVKLPFLDEYNQKRRQITQEIKENCCELKHIEFPTQFDSAYVAHLFVIQTDYRKELQLHLKARNITYDIHYPIPDYMQIAIKSKYLHIKLPNTEYATSRILTLPCFPEMNQEEVTYLSNALIEFKP